MKVRKKKMRQATKISVPIITAVVLVFCLLVTYKTVSLREDVAEYEAKIKEYEIDIQELKKEREQIEAEREYVKTDRYVEKIAREKLGLVYENEIIFQADGRE